MTEDNKYTKSLRIRAAQLDKVLSISEAEYTQLVDCLIAENESTYTIKICNGLSRISKEADGQVLKAAVALKDSLIQFHGFKYLCELCEGEQTSIEDDQTIEELLDELNQLIGLESVKKKVNDLIAFQTINKKREDIGLYSEKSTLHMAFVGNPGTGKTTVARIVGRIYKQLNLLSKGHFVEVSRTDLIAGYQGQTALKVKEVINRAKGGVLFIDEAYSITENDHSDSYGRECLTELTKALEDYRDDLVVIVAGYTEPMEKFFDSNPGLRSRINCFINFTDYEENELVEMFENLCEKNNYFLTEKALDKIKDIICEKTAAKGKDFSNGRMVRNLFEAVVMNQARRVYALEQIQEEDLKNILEDDVVF